MGTPWVWLFVAIPLGAVIGSYITTMALRSTRQEQATSGRSRCDACQAPLGYGQTLPIVSHLILRGRCAACRAPIEAVHPWGEVASVVVAASVVFAPSMARGGLMAMLGATLLASSVVDAKTQRLPNVLTLAIAVLAGLLAFDRSPRALLWGLASAAAITAVLQIVRWAGMMRRKEPGLGFGDVKLAAALALWLGVRVSWMLAVAAALGLLAMAWRRRPGERLAFGPMIAAAAWLVGAPMEWGWWTATI